MKKTTASGRPAVDPTNPAVPDPGLKDNGQHKDYWILSAEERAKGFIRPVREVYFHLKCGTTTRMSLAIAETYARDPFFYGSTFCCFCCKHYPVGADGEFVWEDNHQQKVGT